MNAQEAYDSIVAHFSQPDAKFGYELHTFGIGGMCVYRSNKDPANPIRCSVGCLIPNDLYNERFEGRSISELMCDLKHPELRKMFADSITFEFIRKAQRCHDRNAQRGATIDAFLTQLHKLAAEYSLEVK